MHAAYQAQAEPLGVSDQAVYDKLRHVALRVAADGPDLGGVGLGADAGQRGCPG